MNAPGGPGAFILSEWSRGDLFDLYYFFRSLSLGSTS